VSLDKIKEAVLRTSRTEAEHISAAAEKEAAKKIETEKENLRREFEYLFQTRSRLIEEDYTRQLAQHQGAAAKNILEAKNASIRAIFEKVNEMILAWSPDEYRRIMQGFLMRTTADRGGKVRVHPDDRETFAGILNEMNAGRSGTTALAIDEAPLKEKGGFLFISENYEIDSTVRTILDGIQQELLPDIARDLTNI
jgi:vacuolar-type H+-ATPase subunit E/Vma4